MPGGQILRPQTGLERSLRDLGVQCRGDTVCQLELGSAQLPLWAEPAPEADLGGGWFVGQAPGAAGASFRALQMSLRRRISGRSLGIHQPPAPTSQDGPAGGPAQSWPELHRKRRWVEGLDGPSLQSASAGSMPGLRNELGFPGGSAGKESACSAGDPGSIRGLGRYAGEGTGYPLQYSWASLVAQLVQNPPAMWET